MKKLFVISFFFFPSFVFSQFFVDYNIGYGLSLNGFKEPYDIVSFEDYKITREPFLQYIQSPSGECFIYLPTGKGITNYLFGGYNINKYFNVKLGFGANLNKLNFNSLNLKNSYVIFENTLERGTINTDEYFYLFQLGQRQVAYNIYNINPVIGLHYPFKKIKVGANAGLLLSFINLKMHKEIYRYGLKGTQDGYYEYSYESLYTIINKKPIVSFNLGLDFEYVISENLSCIVNFGYKKIKYTPKAGLYQKYNISGYDYGTILDKPDYSQNAVFVDYESLAESQYDQIYDYNFSTIDFNIGLRYTFGKANASNSKNQIPVLPVSWRRCKRQ